MQRGGRAHRSRHVVVVARRNDLGYRRLGVTVPSKVGKAVARNRVKRWFREIFRHHRDELPPGVDVVLIGKPGSPSAGYHGIKGEVRDLFARLAAEMDQVELRPRGQEEGR